MVLSSNRLQGAGAGALILSIVLGGILQPNLEQSISFTNTHKVFIVLTPERDTLQLALVVCEADLYILMLLVS